MLTRPMFLLWALALTSLVGLSVNTASLPPNAEPVPLDSVCLVMTGINLNATDLAQNDVPSDIVGAQSRVGGTIFAYYGLSETYRALVIEVGDAGVGGTLGWYYRTAGGWAPLPAPHGSPNLDQEGTSEFRFARPDDWVPYSPLAECGGPLYYIRSVTGAAYDVPPLISTAKAIV